MKKKVLIVDDSMLIRNGLKLMFKKTGNWETITAKNGKEGIEKIIENKPDIVVMDVEMPIMDGITALKEIRKLKTEGKIERNLPVIILSGTMYQNDENVRRAKMFGATDVMAKPEGKSSTINVNFKELEEKIKKVLH